MQIKLAEISFDDGLTLVARCYEKNANNAIMSMLQNIPGQLSTAYNGLSDSAKQSLLHAGIGAGIGGGLGMASGFTQPRDRRNTLARTLTGALTGGAMGALINPARQLLQNPSLNIQADDLASAQAAKEKAVKKIPFGGIPTGETKAVPLGPDPTNPNQPVDQQPTAAAPVTRAPNRLSAAAETLNPDRYLDPETGATAALDLALGRTRGNKSGTKTEMATDAVSALAPYVTGTAAGMKAHGMVADSQAAAAHMPTASMSGGKTLDHIMTNANAGHGLDDAAKQSLTKAVNTMRQAGMDYEEIAKVLSQHGTDPAAIVKGIGLPPILSPGDTSLPAQLSSLQAELSAATDDTTRSYIKSQMEPLLRQQALQQARGVLAQGLESPATAARAGVKAAPMPTHMTPSAVQDAMGRTRVNKYVPTRLQSLGRGAAGLAVGAGTGLATRMGIDALAPESWQEALRRNAEDLKNQGLSE